MGTQGEEARKSRDGSGNGVSSFCSPELPTQS